MDKKDFFARTMHTPDDATRARKRAALRETSKTLLPLHRALIDAAKADYEAATTLAATPTQLLRLITDDPFFAWLKPVTALIVDIDEMARVDFEPADVTAIAARVEKLFGPNPDPAFAAKYVPLLQREVDVAIAHAALRQAMKRLFEIEN
jgi:hypothetical protein